jgi:hypothetical protein
VGLIISIRPAASTDFDVTGGSLASSLAPGQSVLHIIKNPLLFFNFGAQIVLAGLSHCIPQVKFQKAKLTLKFLELVFPEGLPGRDPSARPSHSLGGAP